MLYSTVLSVFAALSFGATSLAAPVEKNAADLQTRQIIAAAPVADILGPISSVLASTGLLLRTLSIDAR